MVSSIGENLTLFAWQLIDEYSWFALRTIVAMLAKKTTESRPLAKPIKLNLKFSQKPFAKAEIRPMAITRFADQTVTNGKLAV